MRPRVLTCDPETTMVTVAQRMASEHVHAIVVLRETIGAEVVGRSPTLPSACSRQLDNAGILGWGRG